MVVKLKIVLIGSDHSGLRVKGAVIEHLREMNYEAADLGDSSTSSDYPDVAKRVCQEVMRRGDPGILVCATGIGMSIAANRLPGIRAALCANTYEARMAREHNDANVLCLGEKSVDLRVALEIVKTWLESEFTYEERHVRRLRKIEELFKSL
jgi:ribose 5-phosphate isomerase B